MLRSEITKVRIGLFLEAPPYSGGTYQYSQTMLSAVCALPKEKYDTLVVYSGTHWQEQVAASRLTSHRITPGIWGPISCRRISGYLPLKWWRLVSPIFHPVVRKLRRENRHLWIFPAQDTWTYLVPVPSVGTIHDLMHRYERQFPEVSSWGRYGSRERHYRNMCTWADGLLVDSSVGKQQVVDSYGVDPASVHVLPFIAPEYYHKCHTNRDVEKRYGLPSKYILYPGQFWSHKNHRALVEAVASVRNRIPDICLILVGSRKNAYDEIKALVSRLQVSEHVRFLGYVQDHDMPPLYANARALVMPSYFGPTNIPPLEAMISGCPVAVSDIYAMREQLGDAALYFDPSSNTAIAEVIGNLWDDDALVNSLKLRGRERSRQWTQEHFSTRLQKIIEEIVDRIPIGDRKGI